VVDIVIPSWAGRSTRRRASCSISERPETTSSSCCCCWQGCRWQDWQGFTVMLPSLTVFCAYRWMCCLWILQFTDRSHHLSHLILSELIDWTEWGPLLSRPCSVQFSSVQLRWDEMRWDEGYERCFKLTTFTVFCWSCTLLAFTSVYRTCLWQLDCVNA